MAAPRLTPSTDGSGVLPRVLDAGLVAIANVLCVWAYPGAWWDQGGGRQDTLVTLVAVIAFAFLAELFGLYRSWRGVPVREELVRIWGAWISVFPLVLGLAFVLKISESFSRLTTTAWFFAAPLLITAYRMGTRGILRVLRARGQNTRNVAIAGLTPIGTVLARQILGGPWLGLNLVGFFDDRTPERLPSIPPNVASLQGSFEDLVKAAKEGTVDVVYVALPLRAELRVAELVRNLGDTTASVYLAPDFYVFDLLHGRWSSLGEVPVVSVFETPFYGVDGFVKRLEDIILGTLALALASPVMIAVALAIKLTSKGPAIFRQRRYGLNGEVIEILKFRSMRVAEDGLNVKQAQKEDPRITPIGRFIRRTSLDELPQLLNVLAGSMSLVGPRPHAIVHNEDYRKRIRNYMLRHKVKPGITGWAQVNGWRGETDTLEKMEKRIDHDLEYIRRWGLLFDIQILFLTVFGRKVRRNAF